MSGFRDSASGSQPYKDPTPLPDSVPRVQELGVTSAPLKSAAFFIGAYCKEYNGALESNYMGGMLMRCVLVEDFMLCKNEGRGDPGQCLKEGRRVTRCATDLCVSSISCLFTSEKAGRINKMRENCLEQFDAHWNCLELNNQVRRDL